MWSSIIIFILIGFLLMSPWELFTIPHRAYQGLWFWNTEGDLVKYPFYESPHHHVLSSQDRQHMFRSVSATRSARTYGSTAS